MSKIFLYLLFLKLNGLHTRKLEGLILDGAISKIEDFPHSVYLKSFCGKEKVTACGSSVLNQLILLTAAHCVPSLSCNQPQRIKARFGHVNKNKGTEIEVSKYLMHKDYNEKTIQCDIALLLLKKSITFGKNVARVIIKSNSIRYGQTGAVAGWGYVSIEPKTKTDTLREVAQTILTRNQCQRIIGNLPKGEFCAQNAMGKSYPTGGDSGSALIVDRYFQVGLVSYKMPAYPDTIVYTDVTYYKNWIRNNSVKLYCHSDDDVHDILRTNVL